MKEFLITIAATLPIIAFEIVVAVVFTFLIEAILKKNKIWVRLLAIWVGLLLFQTGIYTWLPGKLGLVVSFMDGEVEFTDGALIGNLSLIMFMHSLSIGLSMLSHIWKAIRKKVKFNGKFVLVEIAVIAVLIFLGIQVMNRAETEVIPAEQSKITAIIVVGLILILWGFRSIKKTVGKISNGAPSEAEKKPEHAGKAPERKKPAAAAPTPSAADPMQEFSRVVAEKDRLKALGDYASQIPLLTKATELDVDGKSKARIWNYLGMAHEQLRSPQKAEECYRNALLFDKENPASHNNLALLCSDRGDHQAALRHMEAAIPAAKARHQEMGLYYGNYALIAGKGGNLSRAEDYLILAKSAGYDEASIQSIRRQLGLK
ncbi:MAG: tetratricopeptide repeat protein [Oscillospiraceae bacterium]|nr:tetratricopeptide repeat protein [Oscillospiraceae bacterium]